MRSFLAPPAIVSAALTACAPTPQNNVHAPDPAERATIAAVTNGTAGNAAVTAAASAPVSNPGPVAEKLYPGTSATASEDADADAQGRRAVSTAFVRLGPGGHLLVTMRNGSELVLRDVTMEERALCGVPVAGGRGERPDAGDRSDAGERQCHRYAGVAAARAVDAATGMAPVPPG
jgi:hypothetical protein